MPSALGLFAGPGLFLGRPGLALLSPPPGARNFTITGVTRDSTTAALGGCIVQLFRTGDDSFVAQTTSDGSGNYSFTVSDNSSTYFVTAYKAGAPDVFGTTVNTLTAT